MLFQSGRTQKIRLQTAYVFLEVNKIVYIQRERERETETDRKTVGTHRQGNVESTSVQRHDVAPTLMRRCINVITLHRR